jgi:phosphoserine phosphatase
VGYGNSHADLPHLRLVDEAVVVNAGKRLRRAAAELPVRFVDWL